MNRSSKRIMAFVIMIVLTMTAGMTASAKGMEEYGAAPRGIVNASNNFTFSTAKNVGRWNTTTTVMGKLDEGHDRAYIKFTTSPGDRLYVREGYEKDFPGMTITLYDGNEQQIDVGNQVVNPTSVIPFLFVKCNGGTTTDTFYVSINRPANSIGDLYYDISFEERLKEGHLQVSFQGTASKAKNATTSSTISVNTLNDSDIPKEAVVTGLSTTATLSPSQGITTHTLINNGIQYHSNAAYQGSGSFTYIDVEQGIPAKAEWGFRYVTGATGASTMSRVTMLMYYQYDVTNTFFK